jgi:pimeloyl-ACP methyl ester carboxylesterase
VLVWLQERIQGDGVSGAYETIELLRDEAPKMATDEFAKVIDALTRFHETELDVSAITVPALVLYGEHDAGFIRRHAPELGDELPNATVREVPDAGHASDLDNPEFFTTALREFLRRHLLRDVSDGSS